MRLSSVEVARSAWVLDPAELNPHGKRLFPDITSALIQTFEFCDFPKTFAEIVDASTNNKPLIFKNGRFTTKRGEQIVGDLELHNIGIAAITTTSTSDSTDFLAQVAELGVEQGLTFDTSMIRYRIYVSQIIAYAERDLGNFGKLNEFIALLQGLPVDGKIDKKHFFSMAFRQEGSTGNAFVIERRINTPFSENKWYSVAPCETQKHIELLNKFEEAVGSE